jgi:KDO2-lipid IV(A) lauroyltransferase
MKRLSYFAEYLLVLLAEGIVRLLPRSWTGAVGSKLGLSLSSVIYKRRALILDNLSQAFPEKSEAEKERIARGVWMNIGRTAVEFVRLPKLTRANVDNFARIEGRAHLEKAKAEGKGLILLTAHFTNWELSGVVAQANLGDVLAIARPMKNPYVEKWIQSRRSAGGMQIILHREAVRASLKWLKQKKTIGILADQNLYTGGVFVDFFGRPAATTTLPALLHLRTGAPVLITYTLREGDNLRVIYEPPIEFPDVPEDERIVAYTQEVNRHLENLIRRYPENWFWIHNRWKRKPEPVSSEEES